MPKNSATKITLCRACRSRQLKMVLSFGSMPPANSFIKKKDIKKQELSFPLKVNLCLVCGQVQLSHVVHPDILFREYLYVSSTSPFFVRHFEDYAYDLVKRFKLNKSSLVVDIGSNDGILLKPLKNFGVKVLGVDPAIGIAKRATKEGIKTIPEYFDQRVAKQIVQSFGKAKIITANNTFAHVHDIDELILGIKLLLEKNGSFIFEVPYLIDLLDKNLFDTIYHEHLSYFSISPLMELFKRHLMEIFDAQRVSTHGGSIRVFVKNQGSKYKQSASMTSLLALEKETKLHKEETYFIFAKKIQTNKRKLLELLKSLKSRGEKIVGYGAPAKGNTLLNYFGIDKKLLDYIVDDNPFKQGRFTPGTHIPVVSATVLWSSKPAYILILAWNFAEHITEKLSAFSEQGGKFIIPVPEPKIVNDKRYIHKTIVEEDLKTIVDGLGNDASKLAGKTLLISGGSGFLGSYINMTVRYLNRYVLEKKCKVISIDNYITGSDKRSLLGTIDDKNFEFIFQDVRIPMLISDRVDYIIHAAGLASPFYYQKYPLETIESAVIGAKNLLEIARTKKTKGFLFFSSSEIYGDPDPKFVPTPETYAGHVSSVGPRACYDESKRLGETLCLVYHQKFAVPIKIVRPFNVYGPGMRTNDYRVIPTFLHKALTKQNLPVHGKGNQTRTFCYVTDAIMGFFRVLLNGGDGEVYNVGNEKPEITMFDLAKIVCDLAGNGVKPKVIDYPKSYPAGEPQRRCPDLGKIRQQLQFTPQVDLELGLRRTMDWFRSEHKL